MKIKTSELTGKALDWAVALSDGWDINFLIGMPKMIPEYSTDWDLCGQLIDDYSIDLSCEIETTGTTWSAKEYYYSNGWSYAETPQIAICRAVVSSKLGDEVEIPSELMEKNNDQ
ncbi:phage protein NinX family protein [Xenorhabdus stockiae]|uniref:phage protein NinX family protein n=1 Tax=Xenorhabdus stockiae TaxID=351614 RepID=UPI003CF0496F